MGLAFHLSALALKAVVDKAASALGVDEAGEAVVAYFTQRFTDHSRRLNEALEKANDNAWKSLEIALAGDSFWQRCQALLGRRENHAFGRQVRAFLDAATQTGFPEQPAAFRQQCLQDLRRARKAGLLKTDKPDPRNLARRVADFTRYADPQAVLDAEWRAVEAMADEVRQAGCEPPGRVPGAAAGGRDAPAGDRRPLLLPPAGRGGRAALPRAGLRPDGAAGPDARGRLQRAGRRPGAAGPAAGGAAGRRPDRRGRDARRRPDAPGADRGAERADPGAGRGGAAAAGSAPAAAPHAAAQRQPVDAQRRRPARGAAAGGPLPRPARSGPAAAAGPAQRPGQAGGRGRGFRGGPARLPESGGLRRRRRDAGRGALPRLPGRPAAPRLGRRHEGVPGRRPARRPPPGALPGGEVPAASAFSARAASAWPSCAATST